MPCLLLFCPGTFHSVAAHHVRAVGESTMLTFGMFVSLRMFWCNCLSHFTFNWPSFHRWPVIQNTREILSLLDLREVDEKRHDAGKCHICVTGWKPAARIHYSVANRPPDITLSWTLLKRSAIHGFPTAGGKICCHNPGARERNAHPWVPTQPVEMLYMTRNMSTFFFMENSLLWTCICIYNDKGVLTPGTEDKLVSYSAWKSMPMNNMKTCWFFPSKHISTAKMLKRREQKQRYQLTSSILVLLHIGLEREAGWKLFPEQPFPVLQVQIEQGTIISCPVPSLTSHQTGGKETGRFWSGPALLVPLNWLSARICFGGNGKENWVRPF